MVYRKCCVSVGLEENERAREGVIVFKMEMDSRKLWGFRELKEENRRKLFKAIISSKVTYPPVPLHCINITSMTTLQTIHNRGTRFITGISRLERKTNEYINERAQLKPVNVILYERALKIWSKIMTTMRDLDFD